MRPGSSRSAPNGADEILVAVGDSGPGFDRERLKGRLSKQIAADIGISEPTVKVHRTNAVREDLRAAQRCELARGASAPCRSLHLRPRKSFVSKAAAALFTAHLRVVGDMVGKQRRRFRSQKRRAGSRRWVRQTDRTDATTSVR
ncbi:MAG: LuxR C-terminal-related transcriptional regulator [Roseiarcus sp.]